MQIELLKNYRGVLTDEAVILKGVYQSDDPRLFELAQYLVDNGHARVVGDNPSVKTTQVSNPENEFTTSTTAEYIISMDESREGYLSAYEQIYGRPAPKNIGDDTLRDKVENPPDDTPDIHG